MSEPFTKLDNFERAHAKLAEGIALYDEANDLMRDGLIQRFEFTFELAWKTLKEVFEDEGLLGLNSPKRILREAFASEIITDEELWLSMLEDRNSRAHLYNEKIAVRICSDIKVKYVLALSELIEGIRKRLSE
ncbi:MAG: nucleotidyltransferase substrate binding protein [Desulfitobacterium sp.]